MKLVLYSGGDQQENYLLDLALFVQLIKKKNPLFTYIPASSHESEIYFHHFIDQYRPFGVNRFLSCPVDNPCDDVFLKEALKSDLIHLSGGNTFYFLKHLKKSKMLGRLKKYANEGGVLTGLSAGAIMLTPSINTAGLPHFDRDDNDENIRNLTSMGLVDFEFFPHYKNSIRYDVELRQYSRKLTYPLYALPDGSGIIINGESIQFVGKSFAFVHGKKTLIF
ncbi:MAG: hypothetical protein A2504_00255 [Bdellovibrionales bacterium RIFOXYD12_FULL_39_22]|nr:MAG: hypothetical protein A2385_13865 [Bdellovibrionales bacterium RIFOXYB1_FULL_39_21]OFZ44298.1 MAG: hypothetical protein A2485_03130 [Bdellovibrionales bacterium RIFOXYC12_FULL_39_17]OFZ47048.1 MAG: hypothetical protein A2404_08025 [Bdellovibrionales bacterium RIFOXYC1_FULL_39_130]OFZ71125.1 MAG: hypothetical protein A2451_00355 [Bdellovibrionales bacterium RIFOXYC2_FULL_39_8]OFZ76691.1 MAG: hypothetical protein A2560_17540 [Bdellovibrionales bacterium RIFOXYD1_FULL_39_84]OFZ95926.1 MAG: